MTDYDYLALCLSDPYWYVVPSPRMTECLAGRTAMSLNSMKGIPARMLTSRCSTIKPPNRRLHDSLSCRPFHTDAIPRGSWSMELFVGGLT